MRKIYLLIQVVIVGLLCGIPNLRAQVGSVNHATGTLGVNIPIYTLTEGNLSVPISLSYDGSGVLVESQASNVGLNWQLNAGGFISREVRGLPDETQKTTNNGFPGLIGYSSFGYPTDNSYGLFKDYEPDIFTLFLNGSSVRFVIKPYTQRQEVLLLDDNTDFEIEILSSGNNFASCDAICVTEERRLCLTSSWLERFIVTTSDGIRYHFGAESTHREYVLSQNSLNDTGISAETIRPTRWSLSSIENPKGSKDANGDFTVNPYQKITFTYKRSVQRVESGGYDKEFALLSADCDNVPKKYYGSEDDVVFLYKSDLSLIESDNVEVYFNKPDLGESSTPVPSNITEIVKEYDTRTNNGIGGFNDYKRKDLGDLNPNTFHYYQANPNCSPGTKLPESSEALNNILIWDKQTEKRTGYYLHHQYLREYRYTTPRSITDDRKVGIENARMTLAGLYPITFYDGSSYPMTLLPGYVFTYDKGFPLPKKNSMERDHWGYYNGARLNEAQAIGYGANIAGAGCPAFQNVDSAPNLTKVRLGSLSSVRLPTGSIESYEYELHDSQNYTYGNGQNKIGGLRIKAVRQSEPATGAERTISYAYTTKANSSISSGVLAVLPTYLAVFGTQNYINVNAYPLMLSRFTNTRYVTYGEVKETFEGSVNGKTVRQGYTEYEFYNLENSRSASQRLSAKITADLSWWYSASVWAEESIRGYPKSVRHYNSDGVLLGENISSYEITNLTDNSDHNLTAGINVASEYKLNDTKLTKVIRVLSTVSSSSYGVTKGLQMAASLYGNAVPQALSASIGLASGVGAFVGFASGVLTLVNKIFGSDLPNDNSTYRITTYKLPFVKTRLSATTSTAYSQANPTPIETTIQYAYLSPNHKQATNIKNYRSQNNGATLGELLAETALVYSKDYKDCSQTNSSTTALTGLYFRDMNVPIEVITKRKGRVTGGTYYEYYDKSAGREGLLKTVHSLELSQPLATFSLAGCTVTKHAAYQPTVSISDYNERGLPKVISSTREGGTTTVSYGINNYLPTSISYGTGGKVFTTTREYAVPLWGVSKVQGVSGSFTTITYDDLGRPLLVRDQDGNLVKSYKYKEANP